MPKKITISVFTVVLVSSLLVGNVTSVQAQTAPVDTTNQNDLSKINQSYGFYSSLLSDTSKEVFYLLKDPALWFNGKEVKITTISTYDSLDAFKSQFNADGIKEAILNEYTDLFFVDTSVLSFGLTLNDDKTVTVDVQPFGELTFYNRSYLNKSVEDVESAYQAYRAKLDSVVAKIHQETVVSDDPYTLFMNINDWLCKNNVYAMDQALGTMDNRRSAYSAIMSNNDASTGPVCVGYALGFQALATELGLTSIAVNGTILRNGVTIQHYWNRVQIDGKWYDIDTTWNDNATDSPSSLRNFFLVGSQTPTVADPSIYSQNHFPIYNNLPVLEMDRYVGTTYTVTVNGAPFTDLASAWQEALNSDQSQQTIVLYSDVDLGDNTYDLSLMLDKDKKIIFDTNGHTLKYRFGPLFIVNAGTLLLRDSSITSASQPDSDFSKNKFSYQRTKAASSLGSKSIVTKNNGQLVIESGYFNNGYGTYSDISDSISQDSNVIEKFGYFVRPNAIQEVTSLTLDSISLSLKEKETAQLNVTVDPIDATNKDVTWYSTNTAVATVDNKGEVTAVSEGDAVIYAEASNGVRASCNVKVVKPGVPSITLNDYTKTINKNETYQLVGTVVAVTNPTITWSSSNPNIASVDSDGMVHGISAGIAIITASVDGMDLMDTCEITVFEENAWTDGPSVSDTVYGTEPICSASSKYGEVRVTYTDLDGTLIEDIAKANAGSYLATFTVEGTSFYGSLAETLPFTINKVDVNSISLPSDLHGTANEKLSSVKLPSGWSWSDPDAVFTADTTAYWAKLVVDETNHDYSGVSGYKDGIIETELTVTVSAATNAWTKEPTISDTTYGTAPSFAAQSKFGNVTVTYFDSDENIVNDITTANAGLYKARFTVEETSDYSGLSKTLTFNIGKIKINSISLPAGLSGDSRQNLAAITLPSGWSWSDPNEVLTPDKTEYLAKLAIDETNYDYSGIPGYHEGYIEQTVPVKVASLTNSWIKAVSIEDWTYGENASIPRGEVQYGSVSFTFGQFRDGDFTTVVPVNAGTWYMKATPISDSDVIPMEPVIVEFTIHKQRVSSIVTPNSLTGKVGDILENIDLPSGWSWLDPSQTLTLENRTFSALFTPDETNIDYSSVPGYNAGVISAEITLEISAHENEWIISPSIANWTYGQAASTPIAQAAYNNDTLTFTYSSSETGPFTNDVPTVSGTWYMKASVSGDEEATHLEMVIPFVIEKAIPVCSIPQGITISAYSKLKDIDLPAGFVWKNPEQVLDQGGSIEYEAIYYPEDFVNYQNVTVNIPITVTKVENKFTEKVKLENTQFGEAPMFYAVSLYGENAYLIYSDSINGTYSRNLPNGIGTYYAKVVIDGTSTYDSIESDPIEFTISKKALHKTDVELPEIKPDSKLEDLTLTFGETVLEYNKDYTIQKEIKDNQMIITVSFIGNYEGTLTYTYDLEEESSVDNVVDKDNKPSVESTKNDSTSTSTQTFAKYWLLSTLISSLGIVTILLKKQREKH